MSRGHGGASRRAPRVAVLFGLVPLAACGAAEPAGGAEAPARHVVLVSIDTLREDRLSCYGYERATTPRLDAFARDVVLFEEVIAPSSWTVPSHFTMLSGLYPRTHGVTLPNRRPAPETRVLAEVLGEAGWHPFAIADGAWMKAAAEPELAGPAPTRSDRRRRGDSRRFLLFTVSEPSPRRPGRRWTSPASHPAAASHAFAKGEAPCRSHPSLAPFPSSSSPPAPPTRGPSSTVPPSSSSP